jgi:hypothetical protein
MITFTLDKKIWLRGETQLSSKLHRTRDGKECCIGQLCRACGLTVDDIADYSGLVNLDLGMASRHPLFAHVTKRLSVEYAQLWDDLYSANDDHQTSDDEKISDLKLLFQKLDIEMLVKEEPDQNNDTKGTSCQ